MAGTVPTSGKTTTTSTSYEEKNTTTSTEWTDVTRRGHRGLGGWWWLTLLLIPLLLAALASLLTHGRVESDLTTRTQKALSTQGIDGAKIDFSGRDGKIALPAGVSIDQARKVVDDVNGVRVAEFTGGTTAAGTADEGDNPSDTTDVVGTGGNFTLTNSPDGLVVEAVVPSEEARSELLDSVKAQAGDVNVIDKITIEQGITAPDAAKLGALAGSVVQSPGVIAESTANDITLTGQVASEEIKVAAGEAAKAFNPDTTVTNNLTVGAAQAPVPTASETETLANVSDQCRTTNKKVAEELKSSPVEFATASANVVGASVDRLKQIAGELAPCLSEEGGATGVKVEGHTDNKGSAEMNKQLSADRAAAVKNVLVQGGLPADKVTAEGFGLEKPVADNGTPEGRAANRRVEITLS